MNGRINVTLLLVLVALASFLAAAKGGGHTFGFFSGG
jgi:hypothetical protein